VMLPLANFLAGVFSAALNIVTGLLSGPLNLAFGIVRDVASFLWNGVLVPLGGFLAGAFSAAINVAKAAWSVFQSVVGTVRSVLSALHSAVIQPLANLLSGAFSLAIGAARGAWSLFSSAARTVRNVLEDIIGVAEDVIDTIGGVVDAISNLPGAGAVGDVLGALNPFQIGGIVTRDQPAFLHAPEVVIPLDNPRRALALAQQSGLLDMLGNAVGLHRGGGGSVTVAGGAAGPGVLIENVQVVFEGPVTRAQAAEAAEGFVDGVEATVARRQTSFIARI
jgi:hypothetical protein